MLCPLLVWGIPLSPPEPSPQAKRRNLREPAGEQHTGAPRVKKMLQIVPTCGPQNEVRSWLELPMEVETKLHTLSLGGKGPGISPWAT